MRPSENSLVFRCLLCSIQHFCQSALIEVLSPQPYGLDLRGVVNIRQWVCAEQNQAGDLPWLDGSELSASAEKPGRVDGRRLEGGQWRQARLHQQSKLVMSAETRVTEGTHRVSPSHQRHSGAKRCLGDFYLGTEETAHNRIFGGIPA